MSNPVSDLIIFQQNFLIYELVFYETEMYFSFTSGCSSPRARPREVLVPQSSLWQHSLGLSPQHDSLFISTQRLRGNKLQLIDWCALISPLNHLVAGQSILFS